MTELAERIGRFVRDVEPLSTRERAISFDPVQTSFLQNLVREKVLTKGVTVKKTEFFKATRVWQDLTSLFRQRWQSADHVLLVFHADAQHLMDLFFGEVTTKRGKTQSETIGISDNACTMVF